MSSERIGYTISSGSLITSGITTGNINFTGSLYQNGAVYSPSTSLKGFQVSATSGNSFTPLVAVGNGASNSIAYSSDGINWTGIGTSIFSSQGRGVAYSSTLSRWVAVGYGTNSIAYSSDGISWTGIGTSIFSAGSGVAYNGSNRWVAVGSGTNTIAYSSDGISWTGIGTSIFSSQGLGVAWSSSLSRWVAVGNGTNSIAYSSDGISWTGLGTSILSYGNGVAYSSALNRWVAVGGGTNTIAYSSDGISWTGLGTSIFSSAGLGVAYSSALNRWVAVGNGTNSIAYSSDGISWTGLGTSILSYGNGVASSGLTSSLIVASQRVQYDTNSNYNNTTGTFTAPSSGIYTINLNGFGNVYITSANTFIPTQGSHTTTAYISAGNTLKCVVSGGGVYNWGVNYL